MMDCMGRPCHIMPRRGYLFVATRIDSNCPVYYFQAALLGQSIPHRKPDIKLFKYFIANLLSIQTFIGAKNIEFIL
jgi:hypothetical protein